MLTKVSFNEHTSMSLFVAVLAVILCEILVPCQLHLFAGCILQWQIALSNSIECGGRLVLGDRVSFKRIFVGGPMCCIAVATTKELTLWSRQ